MPLPEDVVADDPRYTSEHPSHHNQIHAAINDFGVAARTDLANTFLADQTLNTNLKVKGPSPWVDVKVFGAVGDGTTDDTVAIQAAIDFIKGGHTGLINGGTIFFPKGTYACSGALDMHISIGLIFRGAGMETFGGNAVPASVLKYTGTGARFIDIRSATGFKISGLKITYSNASFTGHLLDLDGDPNALDTAYITIENCQFWSELSGTSATATTAVNLYKSHTVHVNRCHFGRVQVGLRGVPDAGGGYANAIHIQNSIFHACQTAAIANMGQNCLIEGCTFEAGSTYGATPHAYWDTRDSSEAIGPITANISIRDCWAGDAGVGDTPAWVGTNGQPIYGITLSGNFFHGEEKTGLLMPAARIWRGVEVHGNYFGGTNFKPIDCGGGTHTGLSIHGNAFDSTQQSVQNKGSIKRAHIWGNAHVNTQSLAPDSFTGNAGGANAKGDLLVHDGNYIERLGVGTNGQVPIADSTVATGIRWGSAGGGSATAIDQPSAAAATEDTVKSKLTTDTQYRFVQNVDGVLEWGPGGSSALDTALFRQGAGEIRTNGALSVQSGVYSQRGTASEILLGAVAGGAGILFGSANDTNVYRAAADVLKTDDKLITVVGLGVGNSAAATTPGSVVKKMEVFDATGASLGFIPIYSTIT